MFIDARTLDANAEITADIVIVGAGAAGITMAMELAASGRKIALLESGGLEFEPETQLLYDGTLSAHDEVDLAASRLRFFGGTTNHWGGHCLPLEEIDFEAKPNFRHTGWPIGLSDLSPFYPRAHEYCDLGRFEYAPSALFPDRRDEFLPFDASLIETVAMRQSKPTMFGIKYRQALSESRDVDVYFHANVTRLVAGANGEIERAEAQTLEGGRFSFRGGAIVLAAGAIETARLMLSSKRPDGIAIGNDSDFVGRCYMDHLSGGVAFMHFDNYEVSRLYTRQIDDADGTPVICLTRLAENKIRELGVLNTSFWLTPIILDKKARELALSRNTAINSLKNIAKYALGRPDVRNVRLSDEYCNFIINADALAASFLKGGDDGNNVFLLRFEAEQSPDRDNRVTLTDARDRLSQQQVNLHWAPTEADFDSVRKSALVYGQELGRSGIGRLQLEDKDGLPYWGVTTAWHQMGTTRMAASSSEGVVDANCKVFGTDNLYVAGAGIFPTGGRSNPTLTLTAMAIRLADHLKKKAA